MKKVISVILAGLLMLSASAYAADYISVTNENNTLYYTSLRNIFDIEITEANSIEVTEDSTARYLLSDSVRMSMADADKEFNNNNKAANVALNTGDAVNNTVNVVESAFEGDDNAYSIEIKTTEDGKASECQFNSLPIYAAGGITVVQNDFSISAVPTTTGTVVSRLHYSAEDASNYGSYQTAVSINTEGKLAYTGKVTDIDISPDTWYTVTQVVFHDENRVDFYLDGEKLGYVRAGENQSYAWLWKYTATNGKNEAKATYLDNFKIFRATDKLVSLTSDSEKAGTLTEGAPVTLNAENLNDEIVKSVKIYSSTDGVNYSLFTDSDTATAYIKSYTTYYIAKAFDAEGNELGSSDSVALATTYVRAATHWDVDFDTIGELSGTGPQYYLSQDGTNRYLNANSKNFQINSGSNGGKVEIKGVEDIKNNTYADSLVLDNSGATADNEVQINSIQLDATDDILITEFDFAFSALPASGNNVIMRHDIKSDTVTATNFDSATIMYLTSGGRIYPASSSATYVEASANTWYHVRQVINKATQKVDFYINNTYLATTTLKYDDYTKISRFSASNNKKTNTLYYDNFKIYAVEAGETELKIDNVKYYIDGEEAGKIAAGNLTASITLTNNSMTNTDLNCIAAVYDTASNKMESISVVPVSFESNEAAKLINIEIGMVSETNTVKIFFWSGFESIVPNGTSDGLTAN